jgi:hypothetical protein
MLPSGAGVSGEAKPPRARLRPPIGWYGIGSTSPILDASLATHSTAPLGRNGRQSSMKSGTLPFGSDSRMSSTLMYCRVLSTTGRKQVEPGTLECWAFQPR